MISAAPDFVPEIQNTHIKNVHNLRVWLLTSWETQRDFWQSFVVCLSEIPLMYLLRNRSRNQTESKTREKIGTWSWNRRHHGYEHSPFKKLR